MRAGGDGAGGKRGDKGVAMEKNHGRDMARLKLGTELRRKQATQAVATVLLCTP
jgi:hypothetical protein